MVGSEWHLLESLCECTAAAHYRRLQASSNQQPDKVWLSEHPSRSGTMGLMEHHLGAILGCSDLHEGRSG